jgi:hydroxylysine kinase
MGDEELAAPFARLDDHAMARLARDGWGISPLAVHRLSTERDDSAVIEHAAGRHVLKVAHPLDDPGVLDLQCAALAHAARRDPGLPLPRLVPDADGGVLRVVAGAADEPRLARLLTYLPGAPLDYTATTPAQRRGVGRVVGRLSLALADFEHGASARVLPWDLQQVGSLRPLLLHVADPGPRAAIEAQLDAYDDRVGAALAATRQQVVHNDMNADNVLVDRHSDHVVTGVLDFGDVVRSSVAADLAVAMTYAVGADGSLERRHLDPWAPAYDVALGFLEARELDDDERSLLPALVRTRLAQRLLVNSWLAACDPANAHYTARSIAVAGRALLRLAASPSPVERGEA